MTGVWIINGKDVFYNQFSTVTFLCPMRFERYPLDEHICKFKVQTFYSNMLKALLALEVFERQNPYIRY